MSKMTRVELAYTQREVQAVVAQSQTNSLVNRLQTTTEDTKQLMHLVNQLNVLSLAVQDKFVEMIQRGEVSFAAEAWEVIDDAIEIKPRTKQRESDSEGPATQLLNELIDLVINKALQLKQTYEDIDVLSQSVNYYANMCYERGDKPVAILTNQETTTDDRDYEDKWEEDDDLDDPFLDQLSPPDTSLKSNNISVNNRSEYLIVGDTLYFKTTYGSILKTESVGDTAYQAAAITAWLDNSATDEQNLFVNELINEYDLTAVTNATWDDIIKLSQEGGVDNGGYDSTDGDFDPVEHVDDPNTAPATQTVNEIFKDLAPNQ